MFVKHNLANILCQGSKSWATPRGKIVVKILGARRQGLLGARRQDHGQDLGARRQDHRQDLGVRKQDFGILAKMPRIWHHNLGYLDLGRDLAQDLGQEFLPGQSLHPIWQGFIRSDSYSKCFSNEKTAPFIY